MHLTALQQLMPLPMFHDSLQLWLRSTKGRDIA
jgi:hypothetical protein